jgi:hypothetical protein
VPPVLDVITRRGRREARVRALGGCAPRWCASVTTGRCARPATRPEDDHGERDR